MIVLVGSSNSEEQLFRHGFLIDALPDGEHIQAIALQNIMRKNVRQLVLQLIEKDPQSDFLVGCYNEHLLEGGVARCMTNRFCEATGIYCRSTPVLGS